MKFQAQLVEWQTRTISAMFTVAAREQSQAREISKIVNKMRLPLADEEADVIDTRNYGEVVEDGARVDLENQPAFEALEAAFNTI